jgi:hypothetical protein
MARQLQRHALGFSILLVAFQGSSFVAVEAWEGIYVSGGVFSIVGRGTEKAGA